VPSLTDAELKAVNEVIEAARCQRCLGRGIIGHMAVGHDQCLDCNGLGVRQGHDCNLVLLVQHLRDRLVEQDAPAPAHTCPDINAATLLVSQVIEMDNLTDTGKARLYAALTYMEKVRSANVALRRERDDALAKAP
jgi:hypothetical protein